MTKILIDEVVVRQALDALEKKYGKWGQGHDELNTAAMTALRQAMAEAEQRARPAKLEVTLEDRPIDIELAKYKRMFEAACSALGQISDALGCDPKEGGAKPILAAIADLKAEQPAPAQEPVATVIQFDGEKIIDASMEFFDKYPIGTELYTTPPAPAIPPERPIDPLENNGDLFSVGWNAYRTVMLAAAPAQQEPDPDELTIAYMSGLHEGKKIGAKEGRNKLATWMMQCGFATGHGDTLEDLLDELDTEVEDRLAAKEWVGLTDEEIMSLVPVTGHRPATTFARAIEAKLKEKNT